ncbi:hypothetical protein C8R42DRAFT_375381 [Lentinula raphanica]|nr:hypothetical protein C8R42DRAFT_375381 [Lentinula raphanica]
MRTWVALSAISARTASNAITPFWSENWILGALSIRIIWAAYLPEKGTPTVRLCARCFRSVGDRGVRTQKYAWMLSGWLSAY